MVLSHQFFDMYKIYFTILLFILNFNILCIAQHVKSSAKTTTVQVRGKPTEEDVLMLIM